MDFEQGQGRCTGHSVEHRRTVGRAGGSKTAWGLSQESGSESMVGWTNMLVGSGESVAGF